MDKALDNLLSDIVLCKYWMEYSKDYLDGLKDAYLIITGNVQTFALKTMILLL